MKTAIFTALALLLLPSVGLAEDRVTARSAELTVSIEGPAWIGQAESSVQDGVGSIGNPVSLTEFIPEGQSFDNWQELFAIMIEEDVQITLDQYRYQHIGRYRGACDMDPSHVYTFETAPHYTLFVIPCGSYTASPETGEVAIFFITNVEGHRIKIYHHIRGPAFAAVDVNQWPGSPDTLQRFLDKLPGLKVSSH